MPERPTDHGKEVFRPMRVLTVGGISDRGRVRGENQDFFGKFPEGTLDLTMPKGQLFVVADGMGGHRAGKEASELAVHSLAESYFSDSEKNIPKSLARAFQDANRRVYEESTSSPAFTGMGTTCTALVLKDGRGVIGHIGDSRIYRITQRLVLQLTDDHSRVADLVRRAIITKEQARTHPERSQLYRALGTRPRADVDILGPIRIPKNGYFLLCTDGLFNHVTEEEMQSIVLAKPPDEACEALVELANERGGTDNITIQVIHSVSRNGGIKQILRQGQR